MTDELNLELEDTKPAPQDDPTPAKSFPLDVPTIEVDIDVSSNPSVVKIVSARMRRATKDELAKREAMSLTEIVEANATEDDIVVEDERGNVFLFDTTVTAVRGFRLKGEDKAVVKEFRTPSEELLGEIYPTYKSAFVKGAYNVSAKMVDDDEEGVTLGGDETIPVNLTIGDEENPIIVIRFEVPEPSETERRNYSSKAVTLRQPKGSRKSRNRIISNIDAAVKLFDGLFAQSSASIEDEAGKFDVTVQGKTFAATSGMSRQLFIDAIDPIYKRHIVAAAMAKYNAKVQD